MRLRFLLALAAAVPLLVSPAVPGQERGNWRAASTTARGVTGDITFTDVKLVMNFSAFTIAQIRSITPEEAKAVFADAGSGGAGNLFRTEIPADKRFAHKNTLCGSDEVQWIVSWQNGKTLEMAMFSGNGMPQLTADAVANTTSLCGTYGYIR